MINERSKEFDVLLGAKLQKIIIRDNETILRFDNGRTITTLLSINVGDTKIETKADLMCGYHNDVPTPNDCQHKWGTDGQHSNIFCKKCFISEEEYEEKTGNIVEMD
jgi:hypothetical protein